MAIFQKSVIQKHLSNLDKDQIENAFQKFKENYGPAKIEKIKQLKEEEYQDGFLRDLFVDVFGYTLKPDANYNLVREFKNQADGRKADGAIIDNNRVEPVALAVIELKSTKTKDFKNVTEQAFGYKNNQPECKYVIISNFQKLRFYIDYANEYEEFDLFHLNKEDFELLYLILNRESVFSNLPLKLKEETKFHEQEVSDKLYKDYSRFKKKLFENLTINHPESDKLTLFKKSQKLLDRFLFVLFAEDSGLLPPNSISRIVKRFEVLKEEDAYKPIYEIFKQYFGYMNVGRKGKSSSDNIPAYNGGLFYPDELLDSLKIDDEILIDDLLRLSEYDFNTDVDVNILGHIFEHSLSEIEEITAGIEGAATDKTKSKRKKDGVFYTPKYITQYIVENTIGTLCNEKRTALEIEEIEFDGTYKKKDGTLSAKGKSLFKKLKDYKDWLLSLKIVDPACGSGAFLNQALNFLIQEHKNIDDIIAELTNTALRLFDTDKTILENNLYGVDINEESVEIAKLSLWLRTAQKGRKLSVLSNNIKCGNSLIDDPEVAGDKAFYWKVEFKEIMDNGGFDVVIGNPPYLGGQFLKRKEAEYNYILKKYAVAEYQFDLYILFYELSLNLCKEDGYSSFISPNTWLTNVSNKALRKHILNNSTVEKIVDYSTFSVFKDAVVMTTIIVLKKSISNNSIVKIFSPENFIEPKFQISQNTWLTDENHVFNLSLSEQDVILKMKIKKSTKRLDELADVKFGVKIYEVGKGNPPQTREQTRARIYEANNRLDTSYLPYLEGRDINSYAINWSNKWLKYGANLAAPRKIELFTGERVLVRRIMGKRLICAYLNEDIISNALLQIIKPFKQEYSKSLLLILSSSIIAYYFRKSSDRQDLIFPEIKIHELSSLPIKIPLVLTPFNSVANNMLLFNKQLQEKKNKFLNRLKDNLATTATTREHVPLENVPIKISKKLETFYNYDFKTFITELKKQKVTLSLTRQDEWEEYFTAYKNDINQLQDEINTTDKEIDRMVYELYGLSEEEIEIVEGSV